MLSRAMIDTPQREHWTGRADLGEGFQLRKSKCGRSHEAVCKLRTHALGWELILDVDGNLFRSKVCRTSDEVLSETESWRAALFGRGWR
jgi:hypothetical protein